MNMCVIYIHMDLPYPPVGMLFTSLITYENAVHWDSIFIES